MPWVFDAKELRYKNTDTGQVLSPNEVQEVNERSIAIGLQHVDTLVDNLIKGHLPVHQFRENLVQTAKETRIRAFLLGRGGRNATFISDMVDFMKTTMRTVGQSAVNFESMLHGNDYSKDQIRRRARLYIMGANAEFYASSQFGSGVFTKDAKDAPGPPYIGDCSFCNGNCRCTWEPIEKDVIVGDEIGTIYEWQTQGDELVCERCATRAGMTDFVPKSPIKLPANTQ